MCSIASARITIGAGGVGQCGRGLKKRRFKMNIKIENRYTGKIIISGEYENIKDCLDKNRDANLRGADLMDANLRGADLMGANLRDTNLWDANLMDANLRGADLMGANLWGANLWGANLRGANLRGADLMGANLRDTNLQNVKNYINSHDIFCELIRRQRTDNFTPAEWAIIGIIAIHRICWGAIQKRFGQDIQPIFEKLAQEGWDEYKDHYATISTEGAK
jgi:hypothetical protein